MWVSQLRAIGGVDEVTREGHGRSDAEGSTVQLHEERLFDRHHVLDDPADLEDGEQPLFTVDVGEPVHVARLAEGLAGAGQDDDLCGVAADVAEDARQLGVHHPVHRVPDFRAVHGDGQDLVLLLHEKVFVCVRHVSPFLRWSRSGCHCRWEDAASAAMARSTSRCPSE